MSQPHPSFNDLNPISLSVNHFLVSTKTSSDLMQWPWVRWNSWSGWTLSLLHDHCMSFPTCMWITGCCAKLSFKFFVFGATAIWSTMSSRLIHLLTKCGNAPVVACCFIFQCMCAHLYLRMCIQHKPESNCSVVHLNFCVECVAAVVFAFVQETCFVSEQTKLQMSFWSLQSGKHQSLFQFDHAFCTVLQ